MLTGLVSLPSWVLTVFVHRMMCSETTKLACLCLLLIIAAVMPELGEPLHEGVADHTAAEHHVGAQDLAGRPFSLICMYVYHPSAIAIAMAVWSVQLCSWHCMPLPYTPDANLEAGHNPDVHCKHAVNMSSCTGRDTKELLLVLAGCSTLHLFET